MKRHFSNSILCLAISASLANAVVLYETNFESFDEPTEAIYGTLTSENIGNAYLGKWVTTAANTIESIEFPAASGNTGLGLLSNSNSATRAAYYTLDGSSVLAGPGSLTFDLLNNYGTTTFRVGVWEVDNGSGTTGNSNLYDTGQGAGTPFSDDGTLGVLGAGDATSTLLGTSLVLVGGTTVDDLAGNYTYDFTATGGKNLVIGFSVEGNSAVQFARRVVIDDLSLTTAAIPEPSIFALPAGMALFGMVLLRRRRNAAR